MRIEVNALDETEGEDVAKHVTMAVTSGTK